MVFLTFPFFFRSLCVWNETGQLVALDRTEICPFESFHCWQKKLLFLPFQSYLGLSYQQWCYLQILQMASERAKLPRWIQWTSWDDEKKNRPLDQKMLKAFCLPKHSRDCFLGMRIYICDTSSTDLWPRRLRVRQLSQDQTAHGSYVMLYEEEGQS